MEYKIAKKSKIITLYDYQVGRTKKIKNDIVVIYLVVNILNSQIGEDAIHLHIDLSPAIDRNIFTDEFCEMFFAKLPEEFEIYTGSDGRCKFKNIDKVEKIINEVRLEQKNKRSKLFTLLENTDRISTEQDIDSELKLELKKLLDRIVYLELSKIDIIIPAPASYNLYIKNKNQFYFCTVRPGGYYCIEKINYKPLKYINLINLI